jgi:hypothetical protein
MSSSDDLESNSSIVLGDSSVIFDENSDTDHPIRESDVPFLSFRRYVTSSLYRGNRNSSLSCDEPKCSTSLIGISDIEGWEFKNNLQPCDTTTSRVINEASELSTQKRLIRSRLRSNSCRRSIWLLRCLLVVADIFVFLLFDDTATIVMVEATPPVIISSPIATSSTIPHLSGKSKASIDISHARALEPLQFRVLERLLREDPARDRPGSMKSSGSTTGWMLSALFLAGVCLEVLWKEVYQPNLRIRRNSRG